MARAVAIDTRLEKLLPHTEELLLVGCYTKEEIAEIHRTRTRHEYRLVAKPLLLLDVLAAIDYEMSIERRIAAFCAEKNREIEAAEKRRRKEDPNSSAESRKKPTQLRLNHRWAVQDRIESLYVIGLRHLSREAATFSTASLQAHQQHLFGGSVQDNYGQTPVTDEKAKKKAAQRTDTAALYRNSEYLAHLLCPQLRTSSAVMHNAFNEHTDLTQALLLFSQLADSPTSITKTMMSASGGEASLVQLAPRNEASTTVFLSPFEILRRQCVYHLHVVFHRSLAVGRLYASWLTSNISVSNSTNSAFRHVHRSMLWAEAALFEAIGCHRFEEGRALLLQAMDAFLPELKPKASPVVSSSNNDTSNSGSGKYTISRESLRTVASPTDEAVVAVLTGASLLLEVAMSKHLLMEAVRAAIQNRDHTPVEAVEGAGMAAVVLDLGLAEAVVEHCAVVVPVASTPKGTQTGTVASPQYATLMTPTVALALHQLLIPFQFVLSLRRSVLARGLAAASVVLNSSSASRVGADSAALSALLTVYLTSDINATRFNVVTARQFLEEKVRTELALLEAHGETNSTEEVTIRRFHRAMKPLTATEQKEALLGGIVVAITALGAIISTPTIQSFLDDNGTSNKTSIGTLATVLRSTQKSTNIMSGALATAICDTLLQLTQAQAQTRGSSSRKRGRDDADKGPIFSRAASSAILRTALLLEHRSSSEPDSQAAPFSNELAIVIAHFLEKRTSSLDPSLLQAQETRALHELVATLATATGIINGEDDTRAAEEAGAIVERIYSRSKGLLGQLTRHLRTLVADPNNSQAEEEEEGLSALVEEGKSTTRNVDTSEVQRRWLAAWNSVSEQRPHLYQTLAALMLPSDLEVWVRNSSNNSITDPAAPMIPHSDEVSLGNIERNIVQALTLVEIAMERNNNDTNSSSASLLQAAIPLISALRASYVAAPVALPYTPQLWRLLAALYGLLAVACETNHINNNKSKEENSDEDSDDEKKVKKPLRRAAGSENNESTGAVNTSQNALRHELGGLLNNIEAIIHNTLRVTPALLKSLFEVSIVVLAATASHASLGGNGKEGGANQLRYARILGLLVMTTLRLATVLGSTKDKDVIGLLKKATSHCANQMAFVAYAHNAFVAAIAATATSSTIPANLLDALTEVRDYLLPSLRTTASSFQPIRSAAGVCVPVPRVLLRHLLLPAFLSIYRPASKAAPVAKQSDTAKSIIRTLLTQLTGLYTETTLSNRTTQAAAASVGHTIVQTRNEAFQPYYFSAEPLEHLLLSCCGVAGRNLENKKRFSSNSEEQIRAEIASVLPIQLTVPLVHRMQVEDWLWYGRVEECVLGDLLSSTAVVKRGVSCVEDPQGLLARQAQAKQQ